MMEVQGRCTLVSVETVNATFESSRLIEFENACAK